MSVKYIDTMKNSRGVHARWAKLIGSYSFTISHAKVIMEDCVSRCPSHLPEPTQEELDMEKDWEPDPPPHLDLEKLAAQSAKLQIRPERICHMEDEQICMNLVFRLNKVQVGWERSQTPETVSSDWGDELGATVSELHHDQEEVLVAWEHDWDWTQSGENHPYSCQIQDEEIYYSDPEIYYSDPEIYYSDPEIYYSDPEDVLGAARDEESDEEPDVPAPATVRRSGRAWKPTQRALESQEQRWEPPGIPVELPPEPVPPERQPLDAEPEVEEPVPAEEEGLEVQAPPLTMDPNNLVLDPIPDHEDVRVDTEGEGLGEPDPLVLARSPEDLSPATCQHIPGPRERAQAQD